jgi:SAC3/GANP family
VEQLIKCLLSLYDMYRFNGKGKGEGINSNEAEFYSLYVLLHLGNGLPYMVFPCPVFVISYCSTGFGTILALNHFFMVNNSMLVFFLLIFPGSMVFDCTTMEKGGVQ